MTMVIAGVPVGSAAKTADEMVNRVREFESAGMDRKDAIATVAKEFDLPKKVVYAAVVDASKS
jgi:16S rRNA (cytidine1402-2'-O)-methyltransferase